MAQCESLGEGDSSTLARKACRSVRKENMCPPPDTCSCDPAMPVCSCLAIGRGRQRPVTPAVPDQRGDRDLVQSCCGVVADGCVCDELFHALASDQPAVAGGPPVTC